MNMRPSLLHLPLPQFVLTHHLFRFLRLVLDVFDFAEELLDGNLGLFQSLEKEKRPVKRVMLSSKPNKPNANF